MWRKLRKHVLGNVLGIITLNIRHRLETLSRELTQISYDQLISRERIVEYFVNYRIKFGNTCRMKGKN